MTYIHDQVLPEGTQIGVHEIKDASKIGSSGVTYRAWNHHLKGWVELHEYFPHDLASRGDDGLSVEPKSTNDRENFEFGLKAFLDQAEILTKIEHPNIAVAENTLQFNGTAYLIMDYQEGVALSGLERSPTSFTEAELKFILVAILNALEKVHEHKIVHGGIQPATILLGKDGEPVLTGFAAARLALASHTGKLADELGGGYAPAEQYERDNHPGPATDFYALGATMYHCISHNELAAAQERVMALSKGEPDPVVSLSGSSNTSYSADFLETIDWMLCPDYNDRPQSVAEVLAALRPERVGNETESAASERGAIEADDSNPVATDRWWVGGMIGVAALTAIGLWFLQPDEQSSELLDREVVAPSQQSASETPVEPAKKDKESVDLAVAESGQESGPDKISVNPENELREPDKQPTQVDAQPLGKPRAVDKASENSPAGDSTPLPARAPVVKPKLDDKVVAAPGSEASETQQLAVADNPPSLPKKRVPSKIPVDEGSIKSYLDAAEEAFAAMRFTTPVGDNAYEYYQTVLATDPDNKEALGGLQKMVDWYVQLIEKAQEEGQPNTARVYLQRAEAVLPDAPNLQGLRAELTSAEE